jgi:hypothetical protein
VLIEIVLRRPPLSNFAKRAAARRLPNMPP